MSSNEKANACAHVDSQLLFYTVQQPAHIIKRLPSPLDSSGFTIPFSCRDFKMTPIPY